MDVDEEPPLGPDGDLVAQMVSDAVVPRLTKAFEAGAYDPYSAKQTRRAVDLAEVIVDLAGKDSRKYTVGRSITLYALRIESHSYQALLRAVLAVFHNHILTLSSTVAACSASSAALPPAFDPASRFAMQRFVRKRIKLLRNMLLWRREAGQEVGQLCNRLVGEVIRPALERAWDGGGREMAEKVSRVGLVKCPGCGG
jgi:GC-rich sequence DNA-binding factor